MEERDILSGEVLMCIVHTFTTTWVYRALISCHEVRIAMHITYIEQLA